MATQPEPWRAIQPPSVPSPPTETGPARQVRTLQSPDAETSVEPSGLQASP